MKSEKVTVSLSDAMEARPIAMLVQIASNYRSSVYIATEDKKINAKSIMGMMSLRLISGSDVEVIADGEDEEKALVDVKRFLCAS